MSKKCHDEPVKWYKKLNEMTHIHIHTGNCIDSDGDVYGEDETGKKVHGGDIPMTIWDVNALPENEIPAIQEAIKKKDLPTLVMIHNRYKLSGGTYCCVPEGLIPNFEIIIHARQNQNDK